MGGRSVRPLHAPFRLLTFSTEGALLRLNSLRWLLGGLFILHALLGAAIGLSVDEAHYALYAAHLALSYFDHPPLVGWVQWPLVALHAPTFTLRWLPGMLWLGTVAGVYQLTLRLAALQAGRTQWASEQAGVWSVLVLLAAPLLHLLGVGLLPDTLLMFWSVLIVRQTLILRGTSAAQQTAPWLVLGVLLGLAGLSKYTAIFMALAVAVCLLRVHGLALLRAPRVWAALAMALLLVSPVLIWNARNQWISFAYQLGHGAGGGWHALNVLRFLLLQALAYGPLLWWGWVGVWRQAPANRWLGCFFWIPFGILAVMAGGGSSLPHWTAPAWVALAPFAGLALAARMARGRTVVVRALLALQLLACLLVPALLLSAGMPFMEGKVASVESSDPPNPFADVHGWDAAGARASSLAHQYGLTAVAVQNWTLASRIGWYARPLPVYVLEDRFDQFDLWAGKLPVGASALVVDWSQMSYRKPVSPVPGDYGFARCDVVERLPVKLLRYEVAYFDFFACTGWTGRAEPALQPAPSMTPVPQHE